MRINNYNRLRKMHVGLFYEIEKTYFWGDGKN